MSVLLSAYGPRPPRIWYDDDEVWQPPAATNPHHARGMADLITPGQIVDGRHLCREQSLDLQVETQAMFGPETDFYQLSARSARALLVKLERVDNDCMR